MATIADIECLKWNNSNFKLSNVLLDHRGVHTLALKPSSCQHLKTKDRTTKVSFLGKSNKLVSLDSLNNICVFDWTNRNDIQTIKSKYPRSSRVTGLSASAQGNQFVTCTDNGKVQLWNFKFSNCKLSTEFKGHYQAVRNVEYSADNNYLVSCSNDKTFKIWDCQSSKFVASNMFHRNWVNDAKFFNHDKLIVSCSRDSNIQVFDCRSGKCVATFSLSPDYAETLALKEDFSIAVGTNHGSVQVFDLRAVKAVQKFNKHTSQVNSVKYQHKTPCLVSASKDKQLNVYDTTEGRFLYSLDHFYEISSIDITLDDQILATTSFRFTNEITLWESDEFSISNYSNN